MNIGVFGTKSEAKYLAEQIEKNTTSFVTCFIDNDVNVQNKLIDGKRIISFGTLRELYEKEIDAVIIAVRGTHSRLCIIEQLKSAEIKKVGVFKFSAHDYQKKVEMDETGKSRYIVWLNELNQPVLPYLETNIVDSCNLNCKGCTHFSNLFENTGVIGFEQFERDLEQVAKKSYVIQLRLLGGEPLLHESLDKFIEASRRILPNADIEIVTNGLLIPKQKPELLHVMRDNNVGFLITKYKPVMQIKEVLEGFLQKYNVDYFFEREVVEKFGKTLSMKGNSNPELSQRACISRGCRFLRNGYLYKCPFEGLIDKFASAYGYEDVLQEERGFDIYDEKVDWEKKLNQYLIQAVPMCKFCAEKCEMFEWEIKRKPEKEDWLVV